MKQSTSNRYAMGKAAAYDALGFSRSAVGDVVSFETGMDKVAFWAALGKGLLTAGKFLAGKGRGLGAAAAKAGANATTGQKMMGWGGRQLRGLGANMQRSGRGLQSSPMGTMGRGMLNFGKSMTGMGRPGTGISASLGRGVNNTMNVGMTASMAGSFLPSGGGGMRPQAPGMPQSNISPYA